MRAKVLPHHNWSIAMLRIHISVVRARKEWLAPMSYSQFKSRLKRK